MKKQVWAMVLALSLTGCSTGFPSAQRWYQEGNYDIALPQFQKLADQGNAAAELYLGYMYEYGQGVPQDYSQAAYWYARSVKSYDADAELRLGYLYEHGLGVPQDYAKAHQFYLTANTFTSSTAEDDIGHDYLYGHGVALDYPTAFRWFSKAAQHGDSHAAGNLAYMYLYGLGTPKDTDAAVRWYREGTRRGDRPSELALAVAYQGGLYGLEKDDTLAQKYYDQAAQGFVRNDQELMDAVSAIVDAHKVYPAEAVQAHQEGTVRMAFLCEDRTVTAYQVMRSSGYPLLDQAAKKALADSYFPARAPQMQGNKTFTLDFQFVLDPAQPASPAVMAPAAATVAD